MIWVAEFYFGQVTSLLETLLPGCKRRSLNQMVLSAINESSRKLRGDMRSREEESEPLAVGSQPRGCSGLGLGWGADSSILEFSISLCTRVLGGVCG